MTNAEPLSTDSTPERAETTESQSPRVAVSEENLAALLRATTARPEPAAEEQVKVPVAQRKDRPVGEEPVANAPVAAVESRRALFAAVKEHRSEILRAAETREPAPVEQQEYLSRSLPTGAAPIQVPLPKAETGMAVAPAATASPARNGLVAAGIVGVLILVPVIFFLWPKGHPAKTPPVAVAAPTDNTPLQVQAELRGNGLINVRWNALSPVIAQARDGRLVITERDKAPRTMALDVAQLKIGHLTYQSMGDGIQFDLEVNDRSGTVAKESILSLSSPAGTAPQAPREPVAAGKPPVVQQAAPQKVETPAPAILQATLEVPQSRPAKARAFVPPASQQKKEEDGVIDAPPALASAPTTPLGVNLPAFLAPIPAPPPRAPQQIRVASDLQAANLIRKVVPVYPSLAMSAGIEGLVRFTAVIGQDGKIQNLKLISGPSPLVNAASDAVKRWVYRPTQLNGQPVEVITQIDVNFTINRATR